MTVKVGPVSEKFEVEVFYRNSGVWVFKRPDRGYPSISIQGDSLALMLSRIESTIKQLESGQWNEEGEYDLGFVRDALLGFWTIYQQHGIRDGVLRTQDQPKEEE
ncbi:hypothetical protein V3W47_01100 [Deinococcus sp. YIM 134068]|uniref:DUF6959 family protein n=1 Tax=Deinococcus lichenicola TaxID=3118910 RepID=UPI002F9489A3